MSARRILEAFLEDDAALAHLVLDRQGLVVSANRHARVTISPDLVGRHFTAILVDFTRTFDLEALLERPDQAHLINITQADGLPQTLYFRFHQDGQLIHAFGEVNSLEVQTLRRTLVQTNNELANLTRELQKANAELTRLGELKNRFLGMAAHDMRSPLGAILGYSQFLQEEDCISDEEREFLVIIEDSSRFMLGLIDDLLDFSRIESGSLGLDRQPTDFLAQLKRNLALNRVLAAKKDIAIEGHFHEAIPPAIAIDKAKMEQVLNNLISNAVKFSPPGSTVRVELFMSGELVTVAVRDQGPGIPPEDLKRIFEPFGRGSARPTGDERSTGLGLHIVRRIVLGHGGKLWVESEPGRGASFYFTIPQGPDDDAA